MFSTSCHYGLQAMCYLARKNADSEIVDLSEISEAQQIPKHFLSKILQQLVKGKLLSSMRGPNGGFQLTKPPIQIKLIDIVRIIDGLDIFEQCGIGYKLCNPEKICPIHDEFSEQRRSVYSLFSETSLDSLSESTVTN